MILDSYVSFLDKLFEEIEKLGINVSNLKLDHLAYRTESNEIFENMKPEVAKLGELVHENYISGNTVRIYKLNEPLQYHGYTISAIELIGPNKNIHYPNGFEHTEFVIEDDFKDYANKYASLEWNRIAVDRPEFPMLKLTLQKYMQVKFIHKSVLEIAKQINKK